MSDLNPELLAKAAFSNRWAALARVGYDLETVGTWDVTLPRAQRLLVPIDVQAFVSSAAAAEGVVAVGGVRDDPAPFADPAPLAPGVHLHWAMPDALLRGRHDPATGSLVLPTLPDRWVVVRTVLPARWRTAHVRGWIVDAQSGQVVPLAGFDGTLPAGPDPLTRLDGASGGTLLWSATYAGAAGRFTLHDPLDDLDQIRDQAGELHGGRAVYTVAGWWSDEAADPLAGARGPVRLLSALTALGWSANLDAADDEVPVEDRRIKRSRSGAGLTSPDGSPPVTWVTKDSRTRSRYGAHAQDSALPVDTVHEILIGPALPGYHCLLHGFVAGVPIDGTAAGADSAPRKSDLGAAVGLDLDDVAAAFAAPGLGLGAGGRSAAERLCAAFTSDLLTRIGTVDGLADLEEREHSEAFWSFNGPPVPGAVPDVLRGEDSVPLGPSAIGRKGRAGAAGRAVRLPKGVRISETSPSYRTGVSPLGAKQDGKQTRARDTEKAQREAAPNPSPAASREVKRPAPRMFRPAPAILGLRGVKPHPRVRGDGSYDGGLLRCRFPSEVVRGIRGAVSGASVVPTLGSGAVPTEVLPLVREAVVMDPYSSQWLAAAGAPPQVDLPAYETRIRGEMVRIYGLSGRYDGSGAAATLDHVKASGPQADSTNRWTDMTVLAKGQASQVAAELARAALLDGTPPSPVAVTTWRQPWVPLWVEWQVRLDGTDRIEGWELPDLDVVRGGSAPDTVSRTVIGRSPLTHGVGKALADAVTTWLQAEDARDATPGQRDSILSDSDEAVLARLRDLVAPLDVASVSLDGVREALLGIEYVGQVVREKAADGTSHPPAPGVPVPLFGGTMTIEAARVVDAFGRVTDVPVDTVVTTSRLEVAGQAATIHQPARLQHGGRWLFRLIDPAHPLGSDPLTAREASVDQISPTLAVNPVSGFLLPDHIDEALEVFDVAGNPLGQLMHDPVSDAVQWEPAPGRPLPPDAGPLADIPAAAQHAALLAAGVVRADVAARHGDVPATASSLSALLRTIDTTLWSVDTFAAIGTPSIAGLVGRPIAVVRATLRLDAPDDVAEVKVTHPDGPAGRSAAFLAGLAGQRFPVRIGDLGRSDDAVLGFFVDDDYTHLRVVDKVVAAQALDSGRHRGHLGLLGAVTVPQTVPIDHPFLTAEDTLWVEVGQVVRLTLLMLPAGKVHLTSGILPRKALALADDWVTPGLTRMVPSVRVGPVLVDPAEIRLPTIASLGEDQVFTRRTGPLSWRDDPIVAASQAALLPRLPHEAQEGWIRVAPDDEDGAP